MLVELPRATAKRLFGHCVMAHAVSLVTCLRTINSQKEEKIFNFFKKIIAKTSDKEIAVTESSTENLSVKNHSSLKPKIYTRTEHNVSRKQISEHALKVLYRLKSEGYDAYLVGGCVRDLLLGREPKDFDVATNATPEQVKQAFRNCRLIGRRFRLAHVFFGREIIEVATFRAAGDSDKAAPKVDSDGRLLRDNNYGTIEEDVMRRDFTVNALYYNIKDFSIVDYVGGMDDHRAGLMKLIGDAETRFREDPVRMIRLVRFSVKLGFSVDEKCEKPIFQIADLLANIPAARLHDEALKLFLSGYALETFEMLRHYGLFEYLYPSAEKSLSFEEHGFPKQFIIKALENTDKRISSGKSIAPYFLISTFLWDSVKRNAEKNIAEGLPESVAYQRAASETISKQVQSTAFPKHIGMAMRDVWGLQARFLYRNGSRAYKLLEHPKFREAYDFLLLRAETGGADKALADWWTEFQSAGEAKQKKMVVSLNKSYPKKIIDEDASPLQKALKMTSVIAYIGLGSNLATPREQLQSARIAIAALDATEELKFSSLYRSPPMGPQDQPDYVNAVMAVNTGLSAIKLLRNLQKIELDQGRVRKDERWGARTLDLDILLYGSEVIDVPDLIVPHYGMAVRAFVLYPLLEIAPDLAIPELGSVNDCVDKCPLGGLERLV
jgi:poly(A) polymerase